MSGDLIPAGEAIAITKRGLSAETCSKWGYTVSEMGGRPVQVANYRGTDGRVVAQKVRFPDKDMVTRGDFKSAGLYGQHLWRDGGRKIVITEGEIDALSVSQVQGNRWPVVSIPNGAQGAAKAITKALSYLLTFDEIILMFDMDEEGLLASSKCALLFPPGRCKIAQLPLKDPNEMLMAGRVKELVGAVFEAKTFRPDGIVSVADVRERVLAPKPVGLPWYCPALTAMTYGRRTGEIYALGAGTGVGKTDLLTEQMSFDIGELGEKIGVFALEQHPAETVTRLAGKMVSKRLHVPDAGWDQSELVTAIDLLEEADDVRLYDSFGATDWEIIQNTIRHLSHGEGIRIFYLDHLTALAAAEEDERKGLERIMAEMGSLVKELDIMIILVSHLATPDGKPHEEGGRVMIRHFKGSRSIGFWCHFMFGLERDQQHDDPILRRTTTLRCLKDRFTGAATGETFYLQYDQDTGRLAETDHNPFEEEQDLREKADDGGCPF
jgi:twinkle protein